MKVQVFLGMILVSQVVSFSLVPLQSASIGTPSTATTKTTSTSTALLANKVGIFFGTSTGNTETVADMIAEQLSNADGPFDVDGKSIVESLQQYDSLIVGTPTWNTGADTERSGTGWDELYYGPMEALDLTNKKVAVFGLGDSVSYTENYADATGELHDVFEALGCKMYGYTSQEGYLHEDSKAIRGDQFCGLLLDMVNQEELTEGRVEAWIDQLIDEGFMEGGGDELEGSTVNGFSADEEKPKEQMTTSAASTSSSTALDETVARLEAENAELRQLLEESSVVLDQSIASHDTGYTPHTNPVSGKTMWTSADGRSSFVTEAPPTKSSTDIHF